MAEAEFLNLTHSSVGYFCIVVFVIAYLIVMVEELTHLRKSKPVVLAAGLIWGAIALVYASQDLGEVVEAAARDTFLDYAELGLFLLVAMTYINSMEERSVFEALRSWLVRRGFSLRKVFWLTGILAFFISPLADNLTTALLMCAVVMAVGGSNAKFVSLASINIVVAANAGGAFSPFGDITTLMVWQKGVVEFWQFFDLFLPSLANWLVPAVIMSVFVRDDGVERVDDKVRIRRGGRTIIFLFLGTIATAVAFHQFMDLPPVLGMLTGLSYLQFYGFYLRITPQKDGLVGTKPDEVIGQVVPFDVFERIQRAEWDTLLFFYGVVMCVGGLGFIGYLALLSDTVYTQFGPTIANISVGVISAIVDNIPVMFAVLSMNPEMSLGQWLLVTLTAGVGGSLLAIGSAAGVALLGQTRGMYTFGKHLKWSPVIGLGYVASIVVHMVLNSHLFGIY